MTQAIYDAEQDTPVNRLIRAELTLERATASPPPLPKRETLPQGSSEPEGLVPVVVGGDLHRPTDVHESIDLRPGRGQSVRTLPSDEAVCNYDRDCLRSQTLRQSQGKPFRDFESTVFTVPKKDGWFRLCTDYRPLNEFQTKRPFKMENVQTVAETLQPLDFGMLVDLTDCYLTMGLPHPSGNTVASGIPSGANACNGRRLASVCPKPHAFALNFLALLLGF